MTADRAITQADTAAMEVPPRDAPPSGDPEPGKLAGVTRLHNQVRAMIPVPPLTWDPVIAATAQAHAAKCQFMHSNTAGLGENLYASAPAGRGMSTDPVNSWAAERADYTYASNSCAPGKACGHYTQLVWRASTRLGCGMQMCTQNSPFTSFPTWELWVCNYAPPGNVSGQKPY